MTGMSKGAGLKGPMQPALSSREAMLSQHVDKVARCKWLDPGCVLVGNPPRPSRDRLPPRAARHPGCSLSASGLAATLEARHPHLGSVEPSLCWVQQGRVPEVSAPLVPGQRTPDVPGWPATGDRGRLARQWRARTRLQQAWFDPVQLSHPEWFVALRTVLSGVWRRGKIAGSSIAGPSCLRAERNN